MGFSKTLGISKHQTHPREVWLEVQKQTVK